ncbi:GNAT family N-acetyltransferase [Muricauda sp. JGD-17]|uniref:GNAT family N-acetyltransferase n=1 Tax=Flagellimonas ochracea TaxID=2696472 RepID=A0A964TFH0_9FLAO|nr:GNAT family N-acetyltransferase [Allomuricauda ochracea]NAY92776.1 GNAT family N-acetyltransferase [Allomuricauda ochracea]
MKSKEEGRFYKLQLLFIRIKHGLFLFTLRSFFSKVGLDFMLFYWELEGTADLPEPGIREDGGNYKVVPLSREDLKMLKGLSFINYEKLLERYDLGLRVISLKWKDKLAAFTCIEYQDFIFRKKNFPLAEDEAYLLNMYTYQSFRGKNLAPYLRYQVYKMLRSEGIENIYSVTDYLNKSSIKFKRKLGAKPLVLYGSAIFLKKFHRTFKLKQYKTNSPYPYPR